MAELKTYKQKVAYVLHHHEEARNSDVKLFEYYVGLFHPDALIEAHDDTLGVSFDAMEFLPAFETLRRSRQIIQNDNGEYLPTDPKVIERRGNRERNYREVEVREAREETLVL